VVYLKDCLERFTSEEKIPAAVPHAESAKRKDGYTCSGKCKTPRDAKKHLSMISLPPVLNIHLKV
jgi:ubiquitin C-terminal hydrolase